ncbi:unnamed protein product, partial [marine sediment metagenome]
MKRKMKRKNALVLSKYQKVGVEKILNGFNNVTYVSKNQSIFNTCSFLLFDEPGLGKTIQAFQAVLQNIKLNKVELPTLVICPASLIHIWDGDDYKNYFANDFPNVYVFCTSNSAKIKFNSKSIVIISYTSLANIFKKHIS